MDYGGTARLGCLGLDILRTWVSVWCEGLRERFLYVMDTGQFESFVCEVRPRLARAFLAAFGLERGVEALSEALAYAWEHRTTVGAMGNPAGYLYRVGQSKTRERRRAELFPPPEQVGVPWVEPGLARSLGDLTEHQRICVVLVHGFQWTHREVAELVGIAPTTVQNHLERGMARLRRSMEVVM